MAEDDEFNEENRERQEAEFDFIQAAYLPEEAWVTGDDKRHDVDGIAPIKRIHRRLKLPIEAENDDSSSACIPVELVLTLPPAYPTDEKAILEVEASLSHTQEVATKSGTKVSTAHRKSAIDALPYLLQSCRSVALENAGSEAVFILLSSADAWIEEEWPNHCSGGPQSSEFAADEASPTSKESNDDGAKTQTTTALVLGRKLIYSHHIIAKSKRKAIGDLAKDYKLGGYFKIGWPGIIIIEGREEDCQSFYDQIRTMRWQYLVMRGEEREEISPHDEATDLDDVRRFPIAMKELGEDKMSYLSEVCREAGLEDLFLTSMKIYKQDSKGRSENDEILESQTKENPRHGVLALVDHMNDPKGYTKWLQKACKSAGCTCVVLRCFPNGSGGGEGSSSQAASKSRARPIIVVGLIGDDEASLKKVLKRWRTSRVDVDSKGNPCLERMMDVLVEGILESHDDDDDYVSSRMFTHNTQNDSGVSMDELESTLKIIGGSLWVETFRDVIKSR